MRRHDPLRYIPLTLWHITHRIHSLRPDESIMNVLMMDLNGFKTGFLACYSDWYGF